MSQKNNAFSKTFTRFAYGLGGVPIGVIQNGIAFFLLLYYNLVLGLDAALTALALALALIGDAISDPLVGFFSDNSKSRLGRRHPYMLFAAIPTALLYYMIWHPPAFESEMHLFFFLLFSTILLRTSITIFDVPHNALNAELTNDYHERTELAGSKVAFLNIGGYIIVLLMYSIWLVPTAEQPDGLLNAEAYRSSGSVSAIVIGAFMLISALTLVNHIPKLRNFSHEASSGPAAFFRQFGSAFSVHSFRMIMLSSVFSAVGSGLFLALWAYIMNYFWEFTSEQTFFTLCANFLGALIGAATASKYLTKGDKKKTAISVSISSSIVILLPYGLRILGLFPENGTDALFYLMMVHAVVQVTLVVWAYTITASMTADIVEHGQLSSGYQSEGLILAATTFTQKAGTAGGVIISGIILSVVGFPDMTEIHLLTEGILQNLGIYYAGATAFLYAASILFILGYQITQESFEEAVEATAE